MKGRAETVRRDEIHAQMRWLGLGRCYEHLPSLLFYNITNSAMPISNIKKSRGRPTVDSEAVMVRLPAPLLTGLKAYISKEDSEIGRPEAIRRILTDYLKRRGML